jgi:hypothetical protein
MDFLGVMRQTGPLILHQATNFTSALRFRLRTSGFGDLVLAAVEALLSSSEVHVLPHWTPVDWESWIAQVSF